MLAVVCFVVSSDGLHGRVESALIAAEALVRRQPLWGAAVFTALAALSAMLAFFSSAVIVPAGVQAWGAATTFALLWTGWLIGGVAAYATARFLGQRVVRLFVEPARLTEYERRLSARAPLGLIVLFQLGLPSELPGYVLGTLRYPVRRYLVALAIGEMPYALGTVLLGASFVARQLVPLVLLGAAGIALTAWAFFRLRARLSHPNLNGVG